jgi:hypothetical protein
METKTMTILSARPSQSSTRHTRPLTVALLVLLAVSLLAGCGRSGFTAGARPPAPPPLVSSRPALVPPVTADTHYRHIVEARIAARLRLSTRAIRAQFRADPGSTLMNLAKPLGLAEDQLAATVTAALNHAADAAVQSGTWTARQARDEKRFWKAQPVDSLITEISEWYLRA